MSLPPLEPLSPDGGSVLRRLARRGPPSRSGERCELCATPVAGDHGHVVDVHARSLRCACRPCYLLFAPEGAGHDRFRAVPERYLDLGDDAIAPQQWDRLEIPVAVAFFFHNSVLGHVVGLYPGPGGATESELSLDTWDDLVADVPALASMEPDVEALLVRRGPGSETEAHLVPIDCCYELTGRLRSVWQGIEGGPAASEELDRFFDAVRQRAEPVGGRG